MSNNELTTYETPDETYETCIRPYLEDIIQLRMKNKTPQEICEFLSHKNGFEIPIILFFRFIDLKPELENAWEASNRLLIYELEETAHKLALGYIVTEEEKCYIKDPDNPGEEKVVGRRVKTKHIKPDPKVLVEVLKVLHSGKWGANAKQQDNRIVVEFSKELEEFAG
jgi:hypothetical protein